MVRNDKGSYVLYDALPRDRPWLDKPDELGNWMFMREGDPRMIAAHVFVDELGNLRALGIGAVSNLKGKWQRINDPRPPETPVPAKRKKVKA